MEGPVADTTNKLSIYLVKTGIADTAVIKESVLSSEIDGVGTFFGANSHAVAPSWFRKFFGAGTPSPFQLLSANAKGVLLLKRIFQGQERLFAIVFGTGRFLLNDGVVEERFGLKIVLNTMVEDSFRSVDRTTLGSAPKQSREQTSRESAVGGFGIDIEQDLVRSVTARSKDQRFGKMITGRDSLTVSAKFDAQDIGDLLDLMVTQYDSKAYQTDYDWIDQIADVRDPTRLTALTDNLLLRLNGGNFENIWMAAPDIIDWVDIKEFKYGAGKKAPHTADLDIEEFVASLQGDKIDLDALRAKVVVAISSKDDSVADQWNAYRCIYAETSIDGRVYILNDGRWYEIAKTFADQVEADYAAIPNADLELPNYEHDGEGEYNEAAVAATAGACCMDRKLIQHGGGKSKIEFCDILTADGKLVHVKRKSGSSQLSHLFAQGAVAGELFVGDAQFREKLNEKLPEAHKLVDASVQPDPKQYEVIFAVVGGSGNGDLPFFSKVTLRNARRRLTSYGYKVSKLFVAAKEPIDEGEDG